MELFRKIWNWILSIWKDPVWSKVISAGIILLISTVWLKYSNLTFKEIYNGLIEGLAFKAPIFVFLSLIAAYFLLKLFQKSFKRKSDPIWNEQVGNYKFSELYHILANQNFPVETRGMSWLGRKPPEDDLLSMFYTYITLFNRGLSLDDELNGGGYLYGVLAPKLVSYGLIDKIEAKNLRIDVMDIKYQTSELGHKFYALLEKSIHLNPEDEKKIKHKQGAKRS
ncbi:hypothetical protein Halhy_1575 [Haliscomenobacter hydrossis DSM 1100]|uniref:Uncharacterized protein n=2 Tax=Haliscomenobacter TaxID=2349 RepID=F4KZJ7_HALH1|nr:hypothetical protein Halhy_1575 [Haliscomenobacter hydrossis DSM 1100]